MSDRCKHDLLMAECHYCRPVRAVPYADRRTVFETLPYPSEVFAANWSGLCHGCGDKFDEGDLIRMFHGATFHDDCAIVESGD
jgi:hypothetical protein